MEHRSELRTTSGQLRRMIAQQLHLPGNTVRLVRSLDDALTTLLFSISPDDPTLVVAGHATPELAISADRAGFAINELLPPSPFTGDLSPIIERVTTLPTVIYLSNPNLVSGAAVSMIDLDQLLRTSADHIVIVDERYADFVGVSALHLLEQYNNLLVLRSLAPRPSSSDDPGIVAGSDQLLAAADALGLETIDETALRQLTTALNDLPASARVVMTVHNQLLVVAELFTRLGIQYRLSSTDFILFRVALPTAIGNALARAGIRIDNLEGYPELSHYLRYRIHSESSTAAFCAAIELLPPAQYQLASIDRRLWTIRKSGETATVQPAPRMRAIAELQCER